MTSITHKLKIVQPYFERCWKGTKTFEVRINDRDFQTGDNVFLQEYDEKSQTYTGREIRGQITYVLKEYSAIAPEYIVFSYHVIELIG